MAKGPASDSIMTSDKMKPLLALSKQEPVQAAIGLTTDGEGLILLHKKAKPKKVLSMLRAEAGKAKLTLNNSSMRFGRALVDTDYDSGMVRFFINKDAPGNMRVKLVEVVKRIPYQKVEINVDPSLEDEPEEDSDAAEGANASANGASASATSAPPPAQANAGLDSGVLSRELAALARRIPELPGTDPAKALLLKLATDANARIKSNNLNEAADFIAQLREKLGEALDAAGVGVGQVAAPQPSGTSGEQPTAAALTSDLGALARKIVEASGGDAALRGSLVKLATEAQGAIRANDLAAAAEAIGRLREAVEGGGHDKADAGADALAQLRVAYDKLKPALDLAAAGSDVTAEAIGEQQTAFEAAFTAGDQAAARAAIFELASLSKPRGAAEAAEAAEVIPAGTVAATRKALEDAQKRWDGALVAARSSAQAIQSELETFFPDQAEGFERVLDSYWRDLADAFNAAKGAAGGEDGQADLDAIIQTAGSLRAEMEADPLFACLDTNGILVRPAFIAAFDDLDKMLSQ